VPAQARNRRGVRDVLVGDLPAAARAARLHERMDERVLGLEVLVAQVEQVAQARDDRRRLARIRRPGIAASHRPRHRCAKSVKG